MTNYFVGVFLVWTAVMIYATPGAYAAAVRQSQRRGDPMRLAVWLVGLVMVGGTGRWLFAPEDPTLWKAVWTVAALTGLYVIRLMIAYGRGDLVSDFPPSEDINP